ncbi:MAG TPA: carbohydrate ABC transporter permease [Lachnospiraceae bacterium]|nr:carbohydrate ABC transporter permease [Lachnospiraceae bacterium]HBY71753.1 carbohydrate ABC transporter permease [Lachnospiraceae bacterium]
MKKKIKLSRRTRGVKRSYITDIGIYFILLLFGLIMALPLVYAVCNSIKPLEEFFYFPPRLFVENPTTKNFKDLFRLMSNSWVPFGRYIFNTVFITVVGTAGHVIIASMCAFAMSKHKFPGQNLLFGMVVLSLMFSSAVTSIPNFLIFTKLGWIDSYKSIIIPAFSSSLGLYLMKQFMDQMVPDDILEAARIDGAKEIYVFWKIAMPMVKPAWLTLIMFSVQGLWGMGSSIYIRREDLKTVNYALSQIMNGGIARAGAAAAAQVLMMFVPVLIFIFTQSNIIETMSTSGMKD